MGECTELPDAVNVLNNKENNVVTVYLVVTSDPVIVCY